MEHGLGIKGDVNQTADQMALLPPERWSDWICYLLQVLAGCATEDGYCAFLEDIQLRIAARLKRGKW